MPLPRQLVLGLFWRGGRHHSGKIIVIATMIMIINVEPAHRHHAEPVRIRGEQPLGVLLLRLLDDRERGLQPGAGGAGRSHGGRDPDR